MRLFSKVKNSTFFSYFALFLIPIVVMAVFSCRSVREASVTAEQNFSSALGKVKEYVDAELTSADKIFAQITLIPSIECLYSDSTAMNEQQLVFIRSMLPTLRAFEATNKRIEKIYLYFPNRDYLVSGSGTYDRQTIDHWFGCLTGLDKKKIIELISKSDGASFEPINFTDLKTNVGLPERQAMIAYVHCITSGKDQLPAMIVLVFMNQSEIMNAYNNLLPAAYGNVSTINSDSRYLFSSAPDFLAGMSYELLAERKALGRSFTLQSTRTRYRVDTVKSDIADWNYILSMPESIYGANVTQIKLMMLLIIAIYTATVLVVSWCFYMSNYKPLRKITALIRKFSRGSQEPVNDLLFIEQSVKTILDDNREISIRLEVQKDDARYCMLDKLIKPDQDQVMDLATLMDLGLRFDRRYFFVFLLYPAAQQGDGRPEAKAGACANRLHEELQQRFADMEHLYVHRSECMLICIVNTDADMAFVAARARQLCVDPAPPTTGEGAIPYSLAFSSRHDSISDLPKAYLEALEVKEYKTYWGICDMVLYEQMCSSIDAASSYAGDIETELQIINHIKTQEYEQAIELISRQMNAILLMTSIPLALIKCRMFGIINLLLSIINEMRSMYDLKFMEEINAAEVLLGCQSIRELQIVMGDIFNQMRNYIQQKEKDLEGSRMRAILDFLKDNYLRPDMSVTYLSQVFNRNESYISRSFKRYVGMGFLDYLHSLRIIEAKRLIKEGCSIKEVTSRVGYTNETTLIRAFKRYEGITPGRLKSAELHR